MLQIFEEERCFHLYAKNMSYLLHVEGESVRNLYYGKAIDGTDAQSLLSLGYNSSFDEDIRAEREEYHLWNGHGFHLPSLQAHGEPGRALFCDYTGYEAAEGREADRLDVFLEDKVMGLQVCLRYILHRDSGILARSVIVTADKRVCIDRLSSACISIPNGRESKLRYLTGKWGGEFQVTERAVEVGVFTLQSKRGITSSHFNPAAALASTKADETHGDVWYGVLAHSGNWSIEIEKTIYGNTHMTAGLNPFDFEMVLEPGQTLESPVFYTGFTDKGFGEMSRCLHSFVRESILPRQNLRPVLYNSWEATAFDVTVQGQKALADRAAAMGCELFVLDDGWFGERHSDNAGLGDWWTNPKKFPNGLGELIGYVNDAGMKFGIWVEPEAVNPDSDLYRKHPDWIYRYKDNEPVLLRNQYLLNMSLPQVQEYLRNMLYYLLKNNKVDFIKWDMNRVITDPQSAVDTAGKSLWYSHTQALYSLWGYIREQFPEIELETCSGGGNRVDMGIFRFAEQAWISDNTDPYSRLFIQEGFSQFYPPMTMMCWVTSSPGREVWAKRPLSYRFHSAMCGGLGIGMDITRLSPEELDECAHWISCYKKWRHIVQKGSLYRLVSPREAHISAVQYISEDREEALVFVFADGLATYETVFPIRLQGLEANSRYVLNGSEDLSGSTLMNAGVRRALAGDFASEVIYLRKDS